MPRDHRLAAHLAVSPQDLVARSSSAARTKPACYAPSSRIIYSDVHIELDHGVDNMAMAVSLVASTAGLALMPSYAKGLLPRSIVSRPLQGKAPTIDVAVGYNTSNTSPNLTLFLDELTGPSRADWRALEGPERNRNGLRGC